MSIQPEEIFPLRPSLPLPNGILENQLFGWLKSVRVEGASHEIVNYCVQDFRRFIYTYGLIREASKYAKVCSSYPSDELDNA